VSRPVTLFTGQWADLPLPELAKKAAEWGFDGLELASWGDHFDVAAAIADETYCRERTELLQRNGLRCWAIGAHLVGQAVCDPIDARHRGILPDERWGDGDPEGVRARAVERLKDTARAATQMGVTVVTGFSGSPIWHLLYSFPPNDFAELERGYDEFAERFTPILDVFDAEGVRFALEFLDPASFIDEFGDRVYHVHVKDCTRRLDGRRSILGSHLDFGDPDRGWDFVSPGNCDVDFESLIRALNRAGYGGPLSVEWEDIGMDREWGARDAAAFVRRNDFPASQSSFDVAFAEESHHG
jgi:sugar phosphate isomerase/epimerase